MPDIREFWVLSLRVAYRHWAIYKKDFFSNILPSVVDPALFIVVFGYWLGSYVTDIRGKTYLTFMAPGLAATTVLFTAFFESSYGFYVRLNFENIFKALLTTPIGPNEILCGEFIWVGLKGVMMATGVAVVLLAFRVVHFEYFWLVPIMGALVGVACGAIGLLATSVVKNINQFQTVYALLISPMFFVSGVFYPVDQMPVPLQMLCWLSPLFHGVRLSQSIMWAEDVGMTWAINGTCLLVMTWVLVWWAQKKMRPKLYS